jgi:hypothetical protein
VAACDEMLGKIGQTRLRGTHFRRIVLRKDSDSHRFDTQGSAFQAFRTLGPHSSLTTFRVSTTSLTSL